jgi:hypothetical protein
MRLITSARKRARSSGSCLHKGDLHRLCPGWQPRACLSPGQTSRAARALLVRRLSLPCYERVEDLRDVRFALIQFMREALTDCELVELLGLCTLRGPA